MRVTKYLFFLFGLLALYAVSVPLAPTETGLAHRIDGDVAVREIGLGVENAHELEKRRSHSGGKSFAHWHGAKRMLKGCREE